MLVGVVCLLCLCCSTVRLMPALRGQPDDVKDDNPVDDAAQAADVEELTHQQYNPEEENSDLKGIPASEIVHFSQDDNEETALKEQDAESPNLDTLQKPLEPPSQTSNFVESNNEDPSPQIHYEENAESSQDVNRETKYTEISEEQPSTQILEEPQAEPKDLDTLQRSFESPSTLSQLTETTVEDPNGQTHDEGTTESSRDGSEPMKDMGTSGDQHMIQQTLDDSHFGSKNADIPQESFEPVSQTSTPETTSTDPSPQTEGYEETVLHEDTKDLDITGRQPDPQTTHDPDVEPVPQKLPDQPSLTSDVHQEAEEHHFRVVGEEGEGQFQVGNVEELIHGQRHVHDPSPRGEEVNQGHEDRGQGSTYDTVDVEHVLHGGLDPHGQADKDRAVEEEGIKAQYESGNVETMVHGQNEHHVHQSDTTVNHAPDNAAYKAGEPDDFGLVSVNDQGSVDELPSAGDLHDLTRSGNAKEQDHHDTPSVTDTEHLMHGEGGHDHDVRQLKSLKTKEDMAARDHFDDIHKLLMHEDADADDEHIPPGKTITYKDIMELGLDEDSLKGVDLKKLLLENAREYDDWQREKQFIRGESPEGSFWEQVKQLRERYSYFGRRDETDSATEAGRGLKDEENAWVTQ